MEASSSDRPKVVFYDHDIGDPSWEHYCSAFSRARVPFIVLSNKNVDSIFEIILPAGGYQVCSETFRPDLLVTMVNFTAEVLELATQAGDSARSQPAPVIRR